jgi:hypothetical protein
MGTQDDDPDNNTRRFRNPWTLPIGREMARRLTVMFTLVFASGCAAHLSTGARAATGPRLMVFGGHEQGVYLGCLTCSEFAPESVFNHYGSHGTSAVRSVLNEAGPYGSKSSDYSACNPRATAPPVIRDQRGKYYGQLTVKPNTDPPPTRTLRTWIAGVCAR